MAQPFRVDIRFLRDILRSHGDAEVTLNMTTPGGAVVVHGERVHQALQLVKIT